MAKGSIFGKTKPEVAFNMTPMIDCTFQLIIFFMLTTQMASITRLNPPDPLDSVSKELRNAATISVVPYTERELAEQPQRKGCAKRYELGAAKIELGDTGRIVSLLREARTNLPEGLQKDFTVELRADRSIEYTYIQPILRALQEANMENLRITAVRSGRRGS